MKTERIISDSDRTQLAVDTLKSADWWNATAKKSKIRL